MNTCSLFCCMCASVGYLLIFTGQVTIYHDEYRGSLKSSLINFAELKKEHDSSHKKLEGKLQKLIAASQEMQEDATEWALKHLRRDKPNEFQQRAYEEQFRFNKLYNYPFKTKVGSIRPGNLRIPLTFHCTKTVHRTDLIFWFLDPWHHNEQNGIQTF